MSEETRKDEGLQVLGRKTKYSTDYDPSVLETFQNKHPENDYWVQFNCPEFTTLCPITGQPDFAEIRIMYLPGERMVESKSLKLYLFSFRNHGDFHEDCEHHHEGLGATHGSQIHRGDGHLHPSGRHQHLSLCQLRPARHTL